MLKELTIENFRAFDREVTIRFRPITVLIGRNSAGKSSILKFLLMLQQSLESTASEFLDPEGPSVHLGAFFELRNSVNKRPNLKFSLKLQSRNLPNPVERRMMEAIKRAEPIRDTLSNRAEFRIIFEPVDPNQVSLEEEAEYSVDATVRYSKKGQTGSHEVVAKINGNKLFHQRSKNLRETSFLRFPPRTSDPEDTLRQFIAERFLLPVREEIRTWRHLSAIREESQRVIVTASPPEDVVGQRGEYAMPHLQRLFEQGGPRADLVRLFMASVADLEDVRFDTTMKGYMAHAKAVNRSTRAEAYLSDFGFGVSQCIPIFVQGAMMAPGELLLVEQPEAQLHPTAQIEMGSFFASLWTERTVASLIETHSSNIILRLRRLIAQEEHPLKHTDISIAFVHIGDDGMPVIDNLDIEEDGSIQEGRLPMEFFGADVIESIKMGIGE